MKKWLIVLCVFGLILSITACTENGNGGGGLTGDLEALLKKIYENEKLSKDFIEQMLPGLHTKIINSDNMEYYLGKGGLDIKEAIASEHEMDTVAFSLCLVRVNPGADVGKIKKAIADNIDPMKWICVGVEPENVLVDSIGDVIILVMSNSDAQDLLEAFKALK
jgi:hypothetical protein